MDQQAHGNAARPSTGAAGIVALLLILCAPLAGYTYKLAERHGAGFALSSLPAGELMLSLALLVLPFAGLSLLNIGWRKSADR